MEIPQMSQSRNLPPDKSDPLNKQLEDEPVDYDWRDPSQPRDPEDNFIVDGWRRGADGTFEQVQSD